MRILLAEDDGPLASFVAKGLQAENYLVDVAAAGDEAHAMITERDYELLVLDLNLPRLDGLQVLQKVRGNGNASTRILVLTSRTEVQERVRCLDAGADDYLTKPFSFAELSARVRALLRRQGQLTESVLQVEDLTLDRLQHKVSRAGRAIDLTPKEFALLEYLMRNIGRRVTRAMIMEHVWNLAFDTMTNVVDVYINYLRKKVDAAAEQPLIHTVRGVGYQVGASSS
jgi:two-component system copper resistance phosphate regulon response regulator CusR